MNNKIMVVLKMKHFESKIKNKKVFYNTFYWLNFHEKFPFLNCANYQNYKILHSLFIFSTKKITMPFFS